MQHSLKKKNTLYFSILKAIMKTSTANILFSDKRPKTFSLKSCTAPYKASKGAGELYPASIACKMAGWQETKGLFLFLLCVFLCGK